MHAYDGCCGILSNTVMNVNHLLRMSVLLENDPGKDETDLHDGLLESVSNFLEIGQLTDTYVVSPACGVR